MEPYQDLYLENWDGETWKPIIGYEGLYEISSIGRIKSLPKHSKFHKASPMIRRLQINQDGYAVAQLFKDRIGKSYSAHRLVALHFIENPENKPEVNHKNRIKTDNQICNLEWATGIENVRHSFATGHRIVNSGQNHPNSKLSDLEVHQILKDFIPNKKGEAKRLSEIYCVSERTIQAIGLGHSHRNLNVKQYSCK